MDFRSYLTELFDQPFPFHSTSVNGNMVNYVYLTGEKWGGRVSVMFFDLGNGDWNAVFTRNGSTGLTGQGDAARVFASVVDAFKRFMRDYNSKADTISFSAEKQEMNPSTAKYTIDSRVNLYKTLIKRHAEANGYRLKSNISMSGLGAGKQVFTLERVKP
jgi:hypothetical protein